MKKVCENWRTALNNVPFGIHLFPEFEKKAQLASAEVHRVKTAAEASAVVESILTAANVKNIVAVDSPLQQAANLLPYLAQKGFTLYTSAAEIAEHAEQSDCGISTVEFAIAESGSVCMDGMAYESRVVSMLPPLHIAFLPTNRVVAGIQDAFDLFSHVFDRGYLSFITGPSRTADIERVLTIGCHGPCRFVIIAIEEEIAGGVE